MQHSTTAQIPSIPRALQAMLAAMENGIDHVEQTNYPPHNIYRTGDDDFFIEMSLSGFAPDEINISVERNTLEVSGTKPAQDETDQEDQRIFLHRGLAQRDFKRSYRVGEYIVVRGAEIKNGILTIHLQREVPDEAKPRKIEIRSAE